MKWLADLINNAISSRFCGSIQINFHLGGITNVVKTESFKPPKEVEVVLVQF